MPLGEPEVEFQGRSASLGRGLLGGLLASFLGRDPFLVLRASKDKRSVNGCRLVPYRVSTLVSCQQASSGWG